MSVVGQPASASARSFHADARYLYNGALLGEYDAVSGVNTEYVWFNGRPVAVVIGGAVTCVLSQAARLPHAQ